MLMFNVSDPQLRIIRATQSLAIIWRKLMLTILCKVHSVEKKKKNNLKNIFSDPKSCK